jgi:hypothetical protein
MKVAVHKSGEMKMTEPLPSIASVSDVPVSEIISLKGRSAVVTGAAQGLGKATASRLAEAEN